LTNLRSSEDRLFAGFLGHGQRVRVVGQNAEFYAELGHEFYRDKPFKILGAMDGNDFHASGLQFQASVLVENRVDRDARGDTLLRMHPI
jgi:hypothetical protein